MTTPSSQRHRLDTHAQALLAGGLPAADLRSLLLGVARDRAKTRAPADVLRQWTSDRFVRPAASDPRAVAAVEAGVWKLLPTSIDGVELSPVAPLGTVSAITGLSQDRVLTTTRLTEVVSDSTNALAIEAAARRRLQPPDGVVQLAACQRQLRAQFFGPDAGAHFRLMCLVSSARDRGSRRTEAALLVTHLHAWQKILSVMAPTARPQLRITLFDDPVLEERWRDTVLPALLDGGGTGVVEDPARKQGRGYYSGLSLKLSATDPATGAEVELGDGGLTRWTASLLGDAKERCLVSCLATERLTALT